MTLPLLTDLYRHMEWADAAMWKAVTACPAHDDAKIRDYLAHLHMTQRAFLRAWRGEPFGAPWPTFERTANVVEWARPYYGEAFSYLNELTESRTWEPMSLPWASLVAERLGKQPAPTTIGDTALQVVMHTTYHRGQVHARLRAIGGEPPLVDYIAWIWLGRPAAEWP